jgi:hypothetical protein
MRIREFLHIELENEDEDVEEEANPRSCYSKSCTERELVDGMSLDHPSLAEADARCHSAMIAMMLHGSLTEQDRSKPK